MVGVLRRPAEVRALASFVSAVPRGARGLLLEGAPGIGKSSLAEEAVDLARTAGFRVATVRAGRPETALSYAALADLFHGVPDEVFDALPAPQRQALDVALLRVAGGDEVHDPRAVGLAALQVVRRLATEQPLLVVLDDAPWIDQSSAAVIGFVTRRLDAEAVGVLAVRRVPAQPVEAVDLERWMRPDRVDRVLVGPLAPEALAAVLRDRLDADLPRSVVVKIHQLVEGNPFYALEIAREVLRRGVPEPGDPLPVPQDALLVVRERVAALPEATRAVLAVAAATGHPTTALLRRVTDGAEQGVDVEAALADAERAELLTLRSGRWRFTHPILATALATTIPAPEMRRVHLRLAQALDDPEERARHLALSATGPDAATADALDRACRRARSRGAAAAAAELALLAREHTPDDESARARRTVVAGLLTFEAGDAHRAHELLEQALELMPPGPARGRVMTTACELSWQDTVRVQGLAERALAEAAQDPEVAAAAHANLAWTFIYRTDPSTALAHATTACELAEHADRSVLADGLTVAALSAFLLGRPHRALLDRAVALEAPVDPAGLVDGSTIYSSSRVVHGLTDLWAGDLAAADRRLRAELAHYERLGRYIARDEILCYLALLGCRAGRWDEAYEQVQECLEIGEESGHLRGRGQNIVPRAWLAALRGDTAAARRDATEGLELSTRYGDLVAVANHRGVLGLSALAEGEVEEAATHLEVVVDLLRDSRTAQPGIAPFIPDAVEALVRTGRLEQARAVMGDDRLMGRCAPRPELHVGAARAQALVLAAQGETDQAAAVLSRALERPELAGQPFEHARTLAVLGDVERRRKQRSQAREHLGQARAIFTGLGAVTWAEQVEDALSRTTTSPAGAELSPTERRLAALVCDGLTNAEAADRLLLSVKTVEANLSRIYRKLGIRSRAELVRRVAADPDAASHRELSR